MERIESEVGIGEVGIGEVSGFCVGLDFGHHAIGHVHLDFLAPLVFVGASGVVALDKLEQPLAERMPPPIAAESDYSPGGALDGEDVVPVVTLE